jgi:signal transduction histidine kinase/ActR/RegA family two-component response regulator
MPSKPQAGKQFLHDYLAMLTHAFSVFLDTALGSLAGLDKSNRASSLDQSGENTTPMNFAASVSSIPQSNSVQRKRHSVPGLLAAATQNIISAEVLGYAIDNRSFLGGSSDNAALGFTPLDEQFLLDLASNYPQGTLWSFEESGTLYPAEEELPLHSFDQKLGNWRPTTTCCREAEARLLREHFPGVRQLLFVPLYDLNLGRSTAGCFAFSNRNFRVFTIESELLFMRSFTNNIAAEISRMDAFAISSSKSNFIGSISHELRSPLHGVLAACEFLSETGLNNYQRSLIETQVSCGKTLLQVIEQVLDFSKINSFEKDESSARRHSSHVDSESPTPGPRMQNLFEQTDVCELCEEVVEGSVAGAHLSGAIGIESRKPIDPSQVTDSAEKSAYGFTKNVVVILDFDYQPDWVYVAQSGALRRILMNVLGNSLKYTQAGCIRVRLSVRDMATCGDDSTDTITLSISDTGKGISNNFLRKRLFTPFSQEDHLSAGCGLGLSIVKSLTTTLNGTIEVRSEQDVGTTVSVNLPLLRGSPRVRPDKVTQVREKWMNNEYPLPLPDATVGFVGFNAPETVGESVMVNRESKVKESIKASVSNCMVDWLQMNPIDADTDIGNADYVVILVDERLSNFIQPYVDDLGKKQPKVIALLPSEMSRRDIEHTLGKSIRAFEVVSAPFGPRKLARAVSACEKTASTWPQPCRSPRLLNVTPLCKVKADMEAESDAAGTHGLTCNIPDSRETTRVESTNPTLSPKSVPSQGYLHSDKDGRSPETTVAAQPIASGSSLSSTTASEPTNTASGDGPTLPRTKPRLLLVDDNHINLRFLETFVKKRRPDCEYDCAEDGLQAVEAVERHKAGYSLVFMDLSMPVMDGLEATRKIRALEKERKNRLGKAAPDPTLIVALTGLASSRDQADAFASGVNLFMTKPVKFKEIGKLLDDRVKD